MTKINKRTAEKERNTKLQIFEYEANNAPDQAHALCLFQRVILSFDALREAGIECDGNDTEGTLNAASNKLTSTPEGRAWIRMRLRSRS